jgi:hypothetical protein
VEGSPPSSDTKTSPPVPFGSPPPLGSPSEVSSHRPCSPVFEQGGPSKDIIVIDLSSSLDEEDFVTDVAGDFEFAQQIFGKLNRDVLGPHGDGKVIVLDDFEEE